MAKVKIQGHASGSGVFTITAPNSNTDRTITLPDASVTLGTDATKLPLAGGALTGAVTTNSTFDGRDVAADGVLATNALPKAGGTVTGNVIHNDNVKALFGTGSDLEIYHDGSDSIIRDAGTGALEIRSNELKIKNAAGNENAVYFAEDGAVNLYHNNAAKLVTTATGIDVTGAITVGGAALASPAITKVTQGFTSESRTVYSFNRDLYANNLNFVGQKQAISFTKASASTDLLIEWSMSVTQFRNCNVMAVYTGSSGSANNMKRFALNASVNFGDQSNTPLTFTGHAIWTGIGAGSKVFYWALGRKNDGNNSSYTINPNTTDHADITGQTSSHITVYEGDFS